MSNTNGTQATEEQILYANILNKGMLIGLVMLLVTFGLYAGGIIKPAIPLDQIQNYWSMPVGEYLEVINHEFLHLEHPPTGWGWVKLVGKGDFLNFVGVAVLSGVTILCYLAIAPGLFRRGDKAYGIMALLEAAILFLAASNLLAVGH